MECPTNRKDKTGKLCERKSKGDRKETPAWTGKVEEERGPLGFRRGSPP